MSTKKTVEAEVVNETTTDHDLKRRALEAGETVLAIFESAQRAPEFGVFVDAMASNTQEAMNYHGQRFLRGLTPAQLKEAKAYHGEEIVKKILAWRPRASPAAKVAGGVVKIGVYAAIAAVTRNPARMIPLLGRK